MIVRERLHAARVLRDNPGLKARQEELFASAYADARQEAASETRLSLATFPDISPFSLTQALDKHFWAGS